MNRQDIFNWVKLQYGTEPDYPWTDWNADDEVKNLIDLSYKLTAPKKRGSSERTKKSIT